jgi:uncharacterized protein YecE (DUF72 family)
MEIHIGCSGWFYWHWKGIFYPANEPTRRWFKHYTRTFDTVELNSPFYKWPRPATVKNWVRDAPETFRYTIKVNQAITHERRMIRTKRLVQSFYEIARMLGPQLGCLLFQFPPSYKFSTARLKRIVAQLDPAWRNAVECRHKSWWRQSVYRALSKRGITFCAVSAPRLPESLPPKAEILYVRFHGRSRWYRHDYTTDELAIWAERIADSNAKAVWIYFNNDREGCAIKNAIELRALLQKRTSTNPAGRARAKRSETTLILDRA